MKKSTLALYDRAYNERDKSESPGTLPSCQPFLKDVPTPGIAYEYRLREAGGADHHARRNAALAREALVTDNKPRRPGRRAGEEGRDAADRRRPARARLRDGRPAPLTAWRDDRPAIRAAWTRSPSLRRRLAAQDRGDRRDGRDDSRTASRRG